MNILEKITKYLYRKMLAKIANQILQDGKFRLFTNSNEIDLWAKQSDNLVAQPIEREFCFGRDAKMTQYDCYDWYCGYWAERVNPYLRIGYVPNYNDQSSGIEKVNEIMEGMDAVMRDRKLHENIITIRWIRLEHMEQNFGVKVNQLKVGSTYVDNGYLSTSIYFHYIGKYDVAPRDLKRHIMLVLKTPKNITGFYVDSAIKDKNRNEFELIISKRQHIKIEKIHYLLTRPFIFVCTLCV